MSPENMIEAILAGEDVDAFELIGAFYRGYPVKNLSKLLCSNYKPAVAAGAYIANQIGNMLQPCIDELTVLLNDESVQIRSDVIFGLGACANVRHEEALGRLLLALGDPDPFVHRAAILSIARNRDDTRLAYGARAAAKLAPGTVFEEIAEVFRSSERVDTETLKQLIRHQNPIARRFAVGVACRAEIILDAERLAIVENCNDEKGRLVLNEMRRRPKPIGARIACISFTPEDRHPTLRLVE
ncbi:HEAT repeat domain-containing protein [Pelagibius sp. Alg239-R121]|uniref:HEAT repeat domain-containing protein n=1 Tax=Pelagibius sp. Alg239-R121 TaxID=2993448 RepID=UPI0024A6F8F6|nr:HEAT repeat domain-containing protein [Pelagibius sp. Alg239-R121]